MLLVHPPSDLGHSILYSIVKHSTCCQVDPLSYFEANEPFLDEKRIELARQYITKLCSNPSNPAYDCVCQSYILWSLWQKTYGYPYTCIANEREREMFYLTTHSTHFIYGYMVSDIWLRTILIVRKETRCRHIDYSYRLTARILLYAPSHRQDNTYHDLCYTSRGALAGTRNSSMGPPRWRIDPTTHGTIANESTHCQCWLEHRY